MFLTWTFICFHVGVRCEELTALKPEECAGEGEEVSLGFSYPKLNSGNYFFWYRQYPGKPPTFIYSHFGSGTEIKSEIQGVSVQINQDKKLLHLLVSPAAVSDSAVYYCAVRPTYSTHPLEGHTELKPPVPLVGHLCLLKSDTCHRASVRVCSEASWKELFLKITSPSVLLPCPMDL
uniref:Immunoglobulin V-set domain-containing protein n=1 Tax=Neogobius melanostomus TaxID=47308 RepID=A0A8C6TMG2_9GOBI